MGGAGQPAASFSSVLANDYFGTGTLAYNRNTSDTKITYIPSEKTQIFGKFSIEPFSLDDPQQLGPAGGGTFDGGQPGSSKGRIQNVGLGMSHILTSTLVVDADFASTRQVTERNPISTSRMATTEPTRWAYRGRTVRARTTWVSRSIRLLEFRRQRYLLRVWATRTASIRFCFATISSRAT